MNDELANDAAHLKAYDRVIIHVFEQLRAQYGDVDRLPFLKEQVEQAITDLGLVIRNPPDIPYTYRTGARPCRMPS